MMKAPTRHIVAYTDRGNISFHIKRLFLFRLDEFRSSVIASELSDPGGTSIEENFKGFLCSPLVAEVETINAAAANRHGVLLPLNKQQQT